MNDAEAALAQAKGSYQRALVLGKQTWSGSDLRGKARKYSGHYARSRAALLRRLVDDDIAHLRIGDRGKIGLWYGPPPVNGNFVQIRVNCGCAWKPGPPTILDHIVNAVAAE